MAWGGGSGRRRLDRAQLTRSRTRGAVRALPRLRVQELPVAGAGQATAAGKRALRRALRGCANVAHGYLAFNGMRRGLTVTYRTRFPSYLIGDQKQAAHTLVQRVPWRFTNEVTRRPFYPEAINLGKAFYRTPGPLDGTVRVTVQVAGRTLAHGRVTVTSTCLPQAAFPPPTIFDRNGAFEARFDDISLTRDVVRRSWNFGDPASGDANTSTDAHPVHTYTSAGLYMVTLTITDRSGRTNTVKNRIEIRAPA
jgi:PKD domain